MQSAGRGVQSAGRGVHTAGASCPGSHYMRVAYCSLLLLLIGACLDRLAQHHTPKRLITLILSTSESKLPSKLHAVDAAWYQSYLLPKACIWSTATDLKLCQTMRTITFASHANIAPWTAVLACWWWKHIVLRVSLLRFSGTMLFSGPGVQVPFADSCSSCCITAALGAAKK